MSRPTVSVLVPTYNGAAHVAETVAAVLGQTHGDLEVIVSDDGSTDDTVEIVRSVAGDDPRVLVDAHGNLGIFANPIHLLRQASGELVKFVLQDDVLDPRCIAELAAPLLRDPSLALATSKRRRIDGDGGVLPEVPATTALVERSGRLDGVALGDHLLESQLNRIGELSTVLYRRRVLDPSSLWEFPGWRVRGNGDVVVHLKALAAGDAWYVAEELSAFRTHAGQYGAGVGVMIDCTVDWPHLITGARALGFLADPAAERRALVGWVRHGAAFLGAVADDQRSGEVVDAIAAAVERLQVLDPARAAAGALG